MSRYPGGIRNGPLGNTDPSDIPRTTYHGGQGWKMPWITFKGYREVTQVDPLSPMLFNAIVYKVMRSWATVVAADEAGPKVMGRSIQETATYSYAKYGLITSTQVGHLQQAFYVLTDLFDCVILRMNECRSVSMVCQP